MANCQHSLCLFPLLSERSGWAGVGDFHWGASELRNCCQTKGCAPGVDPEDVEQSSRGHRGQKQVGVSGQEGRQLGSPQG